MRAIESSAVTVCDACKSAPTIAHLARINGAICISCHGTLRHANAEELEVYRVFLRDRENPARIAAGMPVLYLL